MGRTDKKGLLRDCRGMTMVEVLVAFSIFMIMLAILGGSILLSSNMSARGMETRENSFHRSEAVYQQIDEQAGAISDSDTVGNFPQWGIGTLTGGSWEVQDGENTYTFYIYDYEKSKTEEPATGGAGTGE